MSTVLHPPTGGQRIAYLRQLDLRLTAGLLSGVATLGAVSNAAFFEEFSSGRLLMVLVAVLGMQLLLRPQISFSREAKLYAALFGYACLTTLWAPDLSLAMNSLFPMLDFLLLLVIFDSLARYFPARAVVTGALVGFIVGAVASTVVTGFPFSVPSGFSYNGIAIMYLHGVFLAVALAVVSGYQLVPLLLALLSTLHVVATTSIKTNFGIALGLLAAIAFHMRDFGRLMRANLASLLVLVAALAYVIVSNPSFAGRLEYGMARFAIGIKVLQARDDSQGYVGFTERIDWARDAFASVMRNPVFGEGIEAFRYRHGITSHSTPVDISYNLGLLGLVLFYSIFASVLLRTFSPALRAHRPLRGLTLAALVCYAFVSLSGTFFYNAFLAATLGICIALLRAAQTASQESRETK